MTEEVEGNADPVSRRSISGFVLVPLIAFALMVLFGLGLFRGGDDLPSALLGKPVPDFALPPVLTNTYIGFRGVDRDVVEASRAMGMNGRQVLLRAEFPLAVPLVMTGVRTAAVQVVATATLAALVAGGGTFSCGYSSLRCVVCMHVCPAYGLFCI